MESDAVRYGRGNAVSAFKVHGKGVKSLLKSQNANLSSAETSVNLYQTARRRNFQKSEVIFVFNLAESQEYVEEWRHKGKAIPLQAWTGLEGSRMLSLPDFKTIGT